MATPASATASAGYFFKDPTPHGERLNVRKDSTASTGSNKSIENPLLGRAPPPVFTQTTNQQQPSPRGYPYNAPAFETPTNNYSNIQDGLRHRRRPTGGVKFHDEKENNQSLASHRHRTADLGSGLPPAPPPPRVSCSLSAGFGGSGLTLAPTATAMGSTEYRSTTPRSPMVHTAHQHHQPPRVTASSLLPSTTNCWVLAFGYTTADQYEELLEQCSTFGHVLDHRGMCRPGESNWIAIQYSNEMEAQKALLHQNVHLSSNIVCGIQKLDDDDPRVLHKGNPLGTGGSLWDPTPLAIEPSTTAASPTHPKSPDATAQPAEKAAYTAPLSENDILLASRANSASRDSVCNRFMKWVLGIKD